ncbi:hypothetical protein L227DRAFT_581486 [Lentinus tigrinus ALCF2SS1-6]|uniref:Uncharacterized protein n=2 Tax=Lentinus tigrinus TaxID=5365 RepID=A0A5C2RQW7_9APHY|nr:hypothetical protein L227DRAFT_581486 [Lentinus tigrinus ALCF2SS1-6]
MIQQGVSTEADPSREVTIGRIMDYIEARLEAIKAREEEEDEEDERAAKGVAGPSAPKPKPASPTLPSAPTTRPAQMVTAPPTPYTPSTLDMTRPYVPPTFSSPTPSMLPLRPMSAPFQSLSRASKSRFIPSINPKELSSVPLPGDPVSFTYDAPAVAEVPPAPAPAPSEPSAVSMPMKRRREAIASDASQVTTDAAGNVAGTSRRRTRSWRGEQSSAAQGEAMDVEEEGPQRKRVARR